jgi:hypothetical protein
VRATLLPLLALLPLAHAAKLSTLALCRLLRAMMLPWHTLHLSVRAAVLSTCSLPPSIRAAGILLAHHSSCWHYSGRVHTTTTATITPTPTLPTTSPDDRCANPRNLFRPFHAPHPSKNTKIEFIYKNIIKKYIFQKYSINIYIF